MKHKVIFDGQCSFCQDSVQRLAKMDTRQKLAFLDFHLLKDLSFIHPDLTLDKCNKAMQLVTNSGKLYGGFDAFRRLSLTLLSLWPFIPLFYFPGAGLPGHWAYNKIAKRRYFLHSKKTCGTNSCNH